MSALENESKSEISATQEDESSGDQSSAKYQYPDRIRITPEALQRLNQWITEISTRLRGVKLTRADLVNFMILCRDEALSQKELDGLERQFFDEIKFAQWAIEELKTARSRGETTTLSEIISTKGLESPTNTRKTPRKSKPPKASKSELTCTQTLSTV